MSLEWQDKTQDATADPTPCVQPGLLALPLYGPDTRYFFPAILAQRNHISFQGVDAGPGPSAHLQPLPLTFTSN